MSKMTKKDIIDYVQNQLGLAGLVKQTLLTKNVPAYSNA
jgi:hypothetical protein